MPFHLHTFVAHVHLFAYSTLLGTELYQSFVMTRVAYQALPRSAFTSLQKRVFPIYFRSQSLLLILVAGTTPPWGPASVVQQRNVWMPLVVAGVTAILTLLIYGPRTQTFMIERVHQATRDAKMHQGAENPSEEMKDLNRFFSRSHAMSIHLNLLTIGATLWYGCWLASHLKFGGQ
ncbi:hypothetical protein EK21DRAFT_64392 [Setomelanomma holmii]|uniref:TMEM205-like domain-containing protein n=1 Tax=Setomelanomma holmii TaxID=210430 RepID=A0A9P4HB38_9PLEO|nr:hypothetical protein EK21DRAFT_64392 [Setomelanomma holmii]